jgi:membrane protein DedA with SNARE-associated domain
MMEQITALLAQYGLAFVFFNMFLEQAGAPVPAVPTLLIAGAMTASGETSLSAIVVAAVLGSLLGDLIWYVAGRIYGFRVLQLLCRISISPDSCVRQTETRFTRWGAPSLILAKFVPGFSTVAPPVAGALKLGIGPFLAYSVIGAALYAAATAAVGLFFYREIDWLLGRLEAMGIYAIIIIVLALAVFIAWKWWDRKRFFKALRMARMAAPELRALMQSGGAPLVVDVRSAGARSLDPRRIPGALAVDLENIDQHLSGLPPDRDIILYCA